MSFLKQTNLFLIYFILIFFTGCSPYPKELISIKYIYAPIASDYNAPSPSVELIPFENPHTKMMGYKDKSGKVKINPQFKLALPFSNFGVADVWEGEKNWYKINTLGQILYQTYFFDNGPDYYINGLSRIIANEKIGFADKTGKIIIPPSFDFATSFSYNAPVAIVCQGCRKEPRHGGCCCYSEIKGGKWGAIDKEGNIVVPIEFDRYDSPVENEQSSYKTLTFFKDSHITNVYWSHDGFELISSNDK